MNCANEGLDEVPEVPMKARLMVEQLNMNNNLLEDLNSLDESEWPSLRNVTVYGNNISKCMLFKEIDIKPVCKRGSHGSKQMDTVTIERNNILSMVIPPVFGCIILAGVLLAWKSTKRGLINERDIEVPEDYAEIMGQINDIEIEGEEEMELFAQPDKKIEVKKKKKKQAPKEATRRSQSKF